MKYKFARFVDIAITEFWSILLIDLNLLDWFNKQLEDLDEILFNIGYPPFFVRYLNEEGEYGSLVLGDYYPKLYFRFNWRGQLTSLKGDLVIEVYDPNYNWYCQNLKIGYQMAGLIECEGRIETQIDLLALTQG